MDGKLGSRRAFMAGLGAGLGSTAAERARSLVASDPLEQGRIRRTPFSELEEVPL
jgi:hypothetical protein